VALSPVVRGEGEHLLSGINLLSLGYHISEHVISPNATHVIIKKRT
jgi:hypothetical protein